MLGVGGARQYFSPSLLNIPSFIPDSLLRGDKFIAFSSDIEVMRAIKMGVGVSKQCVRLSRREKGFGARFEIREIANGENAIL